MPREHETTPVETPVEAPAVVGPGRAPPAVARVLALQRTAGNQAVTAMLARNGGSATDAGTEPAAGVTDFLTLIADQHWDEAIQQLERMTPPEMENQLHAVRRVDLERLRDHAGEAHRAVRDACEAARVRQLGLDWDDAVAGGRWQEAVTLVQAYNDIDLPIKLGALNFDQLAALCSQADRMLPAYQRTRTAAEPIRVRKLNEEYAAAVAAGTWPRAVQLLDNYNDTDLLPKARDIKALGVPALNGAESAAISRWPTDDRQRTRRAIRFLLMEDTAGPGPHPPQSGPQQRNPNPAYQAQSGGGNVTVTTDDRLGPPGASDEWYSISYTGAEADKSGWLQFIHRDVEKFDSSGASLGFVSRSVPIQGQPNMQLDPDDQHPVWIIDTLSNTSPFYESAAAATTSPTETTMHDMPGPLLGVVNAQFADSNVKRVVSRAHFDTYLVRDMRVLHHVRVDVSWTFTGASTTAPRRSQSVGGGGATDRLPPALRQALLVRFSTYTYIP